MLSFYAYRPTADLKSKEFFFYGVHCNTGELLHISVCSEKYETTLLPLLLLIYLSHLRSVIVSITTFSLSNLMHLNTNFMSEVLDFGAS